MPGFRIYIVGPDGHFTDADNIECADDHEAIHKAQQQAADGHDVELWDRGRFITRVAAKPNGLVDKPKVFASA
jgi:hypothetical protein